MTESYQKIQRQIEALQRQADKLRKKEAEEVVARIKVAIAHYGLTAEQLGLGGTSEQGRSGARADSRATSRADSRSVASARYADGKGNTWSGRGPRPRWLREAIDGGGSIDAFRTQPGKADAAASGPRRPGKKKVASRVRYRDQAGNAWSGRGPKPRWLKDALAAGQSLASLTA
ncbi:H-NS family nucleoid-associated regulatory protein [Variovorax sp. DT-64]|uniref:H-NS family nucleoid-associated regulatory protein n=1 Tax=Variovorax sp. DT-64 TaxID=3396160 RepID=UPI003F19AB13